MFLNAGLIRFVGVLLRRIHEAIVHDGEVRNAYLDKPRVVELHPSSSTDGIG